MNPDEHIRALTHDGRLLAAAAGRAGPAARVPSCPDWRVRNLLSHIGYVHRWAAAYVVGQQTEMMPEQPEAAQLAAGPPDRELRDWYLSGLDALAGALASADPGMPAWTFLPAPSPLAFWARRQAHETAIHRADAELAAGSRPSYPAEFAADGVDELLTGFFGRGAAPAADPERDSGAGDKAGGPLLRIRATDVCQDWHLRLSGDATSVVAAGRGAPPDGAPADCTLAGTACDLYLFLWNRVPHDAAVRVSGDQRLADSWPAHMHVRWA